MFKITYRDLYQVSLRKKILNINFIFYIRLKFISINFFFNKY